jgi:hypothetical protein
MKRFMISSSWNNSPFFFMLLIYTERSPSMHGDRRTLAVFHQNDQSVIFVKILFEGDDVSVLQLSVNFDLSHGFVNLQEFHSFQRYLFGDIDLQGFVLNNEIDLS